MLVSAANLLDRVDLPPPAFPKTATFFTCPFPSCRTIWRLSASGRGSAATRTVSSGGGLSHNDDVASWWRELREVFRSIPAGLREGSGSGESSGCVTRVVWKKRCVKRSPWLTIGWIDPRLRTMCSHARSPSSNSYGQNWCRDSLENPETSSHWSNHITGCSGIGST